MPDDVLKVACFRLGELDCAVDVMKVAEIVNPLPISPVPASAVLIEGVVELRGRFLPVIDLRRRLGLVAGPAGRMMIARLGEARVALLVDQVSEVDQLPRAAIHPAPELATARLAPDFVVGVARWKGRVLYLLDLAALFSPAELAALTA